MKRTEGEIVLSGTILLGEEFEPFEGHLIIREGVVVEIGSEKVESDYEGIICPALVNAHLHLGDSVFKDPPYLPLDELVGPGGLKHRALASASRRKQVEGMRRSISEMARSGTFAFADFREGGIEGVEMLLEAMAGARVEDERTEGGETERARVEEKMTGARTEGQGAERARVEERMQVVRMDGGGLIGRILGRPDPGSIRVHPDCWGVGISSTRDHPRSWLEEVAQIARSEGRKIALHAGESGRDDIEDALSLEPDLLVHLTRAEPRDLKAVEDAGVPVVVCPRSNLATGVGLPDVPKMLELGMVVGLGTDNVMLNSPNLFSEMELLSKALLHNDRQVFMMCTLNGPDILGAEDEAGAIGVGKKSRIMVIDRRSDNLAGSRDPLASVVRRAMPSDVLAVI
ncbi:MAG TPA: amidohydrolase family protein [Methanothrix sp.]|nr:amidohydrolase family protein [Methanothrix sp.]